MNSWWRQWARIASLIFLGVFVLAFSVHWIFVGPVATSAEVGLVFASIGAFGLSFYLVRDLSQETLSITSGTKDSQKSMRWYEDEILSFLASQRYRELAREGDARVFEPRMLGQHMGGPVRVTATSFEVTISGPRGIVRILASLLDLKKIFL